MARTSPKKPLNPKMVKPPPGKTLLPRQNFTQRQRRFSIIDSDSSLSDYESAEEDNRSNFHSYGGKFQAIQSESEDEDDESEEESDDESDDDDQEHIWKSNSKKVVNTSSEDEDSSSSDDENVDFVKLTEERKKKSLEYRSSSPFVSASPNKDIIQDDVDFSFDFNNNDHQLKISNEEEDVGEELAPFSPIKNNHNVIPLNHEPLGFMNIEESSESDGEINRDELLRTLEQDNDDEELDEGVETGDDDLNVLKHETEMIAQEFDKDDLSSANITPRHSIVEIKKSDNNNNEALISEDEESYYEDDDDGFDDDDTFMIPYFDDSGFKNQLYANNHNKNKNDDLDSDDDSYLWDYFFSSGEEDNHESNNPNEYSDDETTDEDTTLPPPSTRKKIGSKAQELLSSSSVTVRPPTLGTWSTDSKPFGIIDGLSTRSLLPNKPASLNKTVGVTPVTNNIEELTLDELLNMSELEDEEDEDLNHEMWLQVIKPKRSVPLSAFRNKGIIEDHDSHLNARRRFSSNQSNSKSNRHKLIESTPLDKKKNQKSKFNEISMTPASKNVKKIKSRRNSIKMRRRQSIAEAAVEGLRVTKSGLFSEDTLNNVEEYLSGLGNETELSLLFREVQ